MTYQEAFSYLHSFLNLEKVSKFSYKKQLNLKRMKVILEWFGNPQNEFKSILIAGTKGKGSTAFFLERLLSAHGFCSGLYTSPHLSDFRERIRIGDQFISKQDFVSILSDMKRIIDRRQKSIQDLGSITFFEVSTLLAFLYFKKQKVDWAVLEVGMGGRLDATNTVRQSLSVIALIGMDHEEYLGYSLELIAAEKAAIIKPNTPTICGKQDKSSKKIIQMRAKRTKSPLYLCEEKFGYRNVRLRKLTSKFDFWFRHVMTNSKNEERIHDLEIALPGFFQIQNASVALAGLVELSNRFHFPINPEDIRYALRSNAWPGRFEIVKKRRSTYILDGAHNPESVRVLASHLKRFFKNKNIVTIFGVSQGKNINDLCTVLRSISDVMIMTKATQPRAQNPKNLLEAIQSERISFICESVSKAMECAQKIADRNTIILITGSLFLVGEAREQLV